MLRWRQQQQVRLPSAPASRKALLIIEGCLTCRKRKVKCDETKPICQNCQRRPRICEWSDDLQDVPGSCQYGAIVSSYPARPGTVQLSGMPGQIFAVEYPNIDRGTIPYIQHFISISSRHLAYPNDDEGNPFQHKLAPQVVFSPALLYSMAALATCHLARNQGQYKPTAARYYSIAIQELNSTLSNPEFTQSDATLGACLLLCVYEVKRSFIL